MEIKANNYYNNLKINVTKKYMYKDFCYAMSITLYLYRIKRFICVDGSTFKHVVLA